MRDFRFSLPRKQAIVPGPEEYARFLITRFLRANGLGRPAEIAYLLKDAGPLVASTLQEMVSAGELLQVYVGGECYVPKAKRRYGYFSLPILWDGKLVARMDCKAERKQSRLHIHHLALELGFSKPDEFFHAFCSELKAFLQFNDCNHLRLHKTSPGKFKPALQKVLNALLPSGKGSYAF